MAHIAIDARIINSTTGRYIERLVTYLQEVDLENHYSILVRKKDEFFWKPSNNRFTVRIADFDSYSLEEQIGFQRFLKKLKPDLVHFCMPQQPVNYRGKKVTSFLDLTLLKSYSSDKNWAIYRFKQFVGKYVFKKVAVDSDQLITISNFTRKELLELVPSVQDKVTTIYCASDIATVTPKKYPLPFKKYILYVGQQSDYKNIKRLGDAHQILLAKYPDLGLVLVGKKNASAQANEAHFNSKQYTNILFTDFVEDTQLSWLYAHAEAYTFPSLMEGFGLPGLEAMGYGTPVVSSNATCLPEIYGQAAHYFNPYDTSDIAEAIDQVLSDETIRTRLSKAGYKQIKKYSWKKQAKETHAVYEKVLKKGV
jgi:glycosyltransferase involved in cell wall biosynthesis